MKIPARPALGIVLAAAIGLVAVAAVRSARPRAVATVDGEVVSPPHGTGPWVAWLEEDQAQSRLVASLRGGRPRVVLAAPRLAGLAVVGEDAYLAVDDGRARALVRVNLPTGRRTTVVPLTGMAAQAVVGEKWVCWREVRPPALPGVPFVVAGAAVNLVKAARLGGGEPVMVASVAGSAELLGVRGDDLYWVERSGEGEAASTAIGRVRLPGGRREMLAVERGWQSALLTGGAGQELRLVWTAPSAEGADPGQFRSVKEMVIGAGQTRVIGDWVHPDATLQASEGRVYVRDMYRWWGLGQAREEQRALWTAVPGARFSALVGASEWLVSGRRGQQVVAVRALRWWERLREGLRP